MPLHLPAMAVASCLGIGKRANARGLFAGISGLGHSEPHGRIVGALPVPLPDLPPRWDCRNNRLLALLAQEIAGEVETAKARFGPSRMAVVLGTSTSGIAEGEAAFAERLQRGLWPEGFHYRQQETGGSALFLAEHLGLNGPAHVVATACSSAAKALASAARLIRAGLADAVVAGGADTLCHLTLAGFGALEALSPERCNPFSRNRRGITIGEGGALFLLTRDASGIRLAGYGETSDAHHVSAPEPSGAGARAAMEAAMAHAGLAPGRVGYVNLHGTATPLNDAMESRAMAGVFPQGVPCSSSKGLTGHTLGAAGAVEAAFLWLTLSEEFNPQGLLPPHVWDGAADPELPPLALVRAGERLGPPAVLSSSFAFGGSNCCLALTREDA